MLDNYDHVFCLLPLISTVPIATTAPPTTSPPPMLTVSITPSGTSTAGEAYSLVCSVTVTGSTDTPTITWLDPMDNQVPSEMVSTTGSMSTLTFSPLSTSHAGTYTCRATVGEQMQSNTSEVVDVTVQGECKIIRHTITVELLA